MSGPVVAGIPFLRRGREELAARAQERLEAGDEDGALVLLLADQDDWAPDPPPGAADCRAALAARTLREAMAHLRFGAVADYFAFRWSDPTFLSALALLDAHAGGRRRAFELGCGIGHLLRELVRRGVAATGADVVFAKLWLCRRFVAPEAQLVCLDARDALPFADALFDLALCHDALHYLPEPAHAVAELRRVAGADGAVIVGHAHNAAVENLSPGAPLDVAGLAALLPGARLYDDAELGRALVAGAAAPPRAARELESSAAIALVAGATLPDGRFALPPAGAPLRRNPLLGEDGTVRWPSERYAREYGPLSGHLALVDGEPEALARRRVLVDLPEAW
jgi:SAM-dependent methyltransferase